MKRVLLSFVMLAGMMMSLSACEKNDDYNPALLTNAVKNFISTTYGNARIVETDYERGFLKVEIIHENKGKDVYFNNDQWEYTEWDVRATDLPDAVTAAIASTEYAAYRIDDVDFIQKASGDYYLVELEKGGREVRLSIGADGTIL